MNALDSLTKDYLKTPKIFADAFNQFIYNGRQELTEDKLQELDTAQVFIGEAGRNLQNYRDVLKLAMTDGKRTYAILGIESQSYVDYAMPVRSGLYDFIQYNAQIRQKRGGKRKNNGNNRNTNNTTSVNSDEFLSGLRKDDKILPVVTLVIYFGVGPWDAPLTLWEMFPEMDEQMKEFIPNYKINLMAPNQMSEEEINLFNTNLREIMLFIKYSEDKQKLKNLVNSDTKFHSLDRQAVDILNKVTNSQLTYSEETEEINMCRALDEIREEGRVEGEAKGIIEILKELGYEREKITSKIAEKFSLTLEAAELRVEEFY